MGKMRHTLRTGPVSTIGKRSGYLTKIGNGLYRHVLKKVKVDEKSFTNCTTIVTGEVIVLSPEEWVTLKLAVKTAVPGEVQQTVSSIFARYEVVADTGITEE